MLNFPIPIVDKQALEELIASRRALSTVALAQELDFFSTWYQERPTLFFLLSDDQSWGEGRAPYTRVRPRVKKATTYLSQSPNAQPSDKL